MECTEKNGPVKNVIYGIKCVHADAHRTAKHEHKIDIALIKANIINGTIYNVLCQVLPNKNRAKKNIQWKTSGPVWIKKHAEISATTITTPYFIILIIKIMKIGKKYFNVKEFFDAAADIDGRSCCLLLTKR